MVTLKTFTSHLEIGSTDTLACRSLETIFFYEVFFVKCDFILLVHLRLTSGLQPGERQPILAGRKSVHFLKY